jgi:hypothetical protein
MFKVSLVVMCHFLIQSIYWNKLAAKALNAAVQLEMATFKGTRTKSQIRQVKSKQLLQPRITRLINADSKGRGVFALSGGSMCGLHASISIVIFLLAAGELKRWASSFRASAFEIHDAWLSGV